MVAREKSFTMKVSEERLNQYIALYQKKYGQEISREDALKEFLALLTFVNIIKNKNTKN